MAEVTITVQKNNGCGDEQKDVKIVLSSHWGDLKMACADVLYTEDELMILEGESLPTVALLLIVWVYAQVQRISSCTRSQAGKMPRKGVMMQQRSA
jgi:hypothetical protein